MKTTFSETICPTPSATGGHEGTTGGHQFPTEGPAGLVGSPFTGGICPTPGQSETPSRELGTTPTLTKVKDAPMSGSTGSGGGQGNGGGDPNRLIGLIQGHQSNQTFRK